MERLDLKRLRKDAEITQLELANRIGYPQAFLSQIEHGKRPAPDKLIKIVVKELGISNINDYIETVSDPVPSQDLPKLEPLSFDNIIKRLLSGEICRHFFIYYDDYRRIDILVYST